jgi:hypothetical protein
MIHAKTIGKTGVTLAAILGACLTISAARAQDPVYCTNSTMSGTYVLTASGTYYPGSNQPGLAVAAVGTVTYDGQGKGQSVSTLSAGGAVFRHGTSTAVFTVNSDCTGTKTFTASTGAIIHYDFVISPNGRLINFIVTDPGYALAGTAVRLDNKD